MIPKLVVFTVLLISFSTSGSEPKNNMVEFGVGGQTMTYLYSTLHYGNQQYLQPAFQLAYQRQLNSKMAMSAFGGFQHSYLNVSTLNWMGEVTYHYRRFRTGIELSYLWGHSKSLVWYSKISGALEKYEISEDPGADHVLKIEKKQIEAPHWLIGLTPIGLRVPIAQGFSLGFESSIYGGKSLDLALIGKVSYAF